ncbi:MAG: histidinol-phosphate transaminase [Gammaproteobacteria bacterium]|jgi:histidinol-phosphate aminotransferase|nr:histidinol-phosphate transaminase [Gammaproteobacteria bacterium]
MTDITKLIRQDLVDIKPYRSGRNANAELIWLDMNESPWDFSEEIVCKNVNRYPEPNPSTLLSQLSEYYQIDAANLLLTRGSDDGIDILLRLFCQPFIDSILICPPTFIMYEKSAKIQGATVIEVPLKKETDFAFDVEKVKAGLTKNTKIIFICSPNNPTGTVVPVKDIVDLCQEIKSAIVVVDEAYIEFDEKSMSSYINQIPNLVVLRTLSKAFGLAGIRCGVLMAQEPIIEYCQAMMPPFPLSIYSISAALKATTPAFIQQVKKYITIIQEQKALLQQALNKLSIVTKIWPSSANFLLIEVNDPQKMEQICAKNGFIVKNFSSKPYLSNCIRMSIGTQEQNQKLISLLQREFTS